MTIHEQAVQEMVERIKAGRETFPGLPQIASPRATARWVQVRDSRADLPAAGTAIMRTSCQGRRTRFVQGKADSIWEDVLRASEPNSSDAGPWLRCIYSLLHTEGQDPDKIAPLDDPRLDTPFRMEPLFKAVRSLPLTVEQAIRADGWRIVADLPATWLEAMDKASTTPGPLGPIAGVRVMAVEAFSWLQWCYVAEAVRRAAA